jgi:hypothetical protein
MTLHNLGRVAGQAPNQQMPVGAGSPYRGGLLTNLHSVIASKELGLCKTILGKELPSTLTRINNLAGVPSDQGNYEERKRYIYTAQRIPP